MWKLLLLMCVTDTSCGGEEVMNTVGSCVDKVMVSDGCCEIRSAVVAVV